MSSTGIVKRKSSLVKSTNDKPPHSYIALIATAILKSPEKRLTLSEINDYLIKHYTFFQGPYKGWRNSVRHNLSYNKCFTKILKDPSRPWGKDNYWTISSLNDYLQEDGSFRRRRRRRPKGKDIVKQELEFTLASDEDESSTDGEKLTTGSSRESQNGSPEARRTSPALPSTTFNSSFSISTILGEKLEPKRQERNTQMLTQGTVCRNSEYRPPVYAVNNLLATQSFFATSAPYYTSPQRNLHWFLALGGSFNSTHA